MGFFDIFKKKLSQTSTEHSQSSFDDLAVKVVLSPPQVENSPYNPWGHNAPFLEKYATAAMLFCCGTSKIRDSFDSYPRYLNYTFGITDPISYHKKLISEGYYVKAAPNLILDTFCVADLKKILEQKGFPTKGRRKSLIEDILNNVNFEDLNLGDFYTRSKQGELYLSEHNYVMNFRNYNISPSEYDAFNKSHPRLSPDEIMFQVIQHHYNTSVLESNWGLARNALYDASVFHKDKLNYKMSLCELIGVLYIDSSGYSNSGRDSLDQIMLAPGLLNRIYDLKELYSAEMVDYCFQQYTTPQHYLSRNQFHNLLSQIFDGKPAEDIDLCLFESAKNYQDNMATSPEAIRD